MSTSNTHQQSLADAGSKTRPPMLERVCLEKRLTEDSYDDLFDYLQQFEKLVNACRVKKLEKSHDPFALVAHTGSSSRTTSPYYVTHPSSVVDYDEDYQGDAVQNTSKDPLTSAMILFARAITQCFSNPINNRTAANVQCYNCNEKGHYARNCPKPRVRDSKYFMEQMLIAKQDEVGVILTDEQNDFLFADASRMKEIEELKQQCDKLELSVVELQRQTVELQKSRSTLKRKMSENEDKYHATILDLEARAKKNEDVMLKIGLNADSSVRRPLNRDLPLKNSVLSNTKKSSEKVEVSVRINKKTYVASKNVILNKKIVTNVDVQNALKEKDVLCVSCAKNVLIPCHDKCIIRFGNDHFAAITGYGNYVQGNITVCHVYYVEGLGHNLFSVGEFYDGDLEVAFRSNTCYVRNLGGDDLLTGARESNLCTIFISDMAASSLVCLLSKATSTKSWLWHRKLSHLNFGTINDLTKNDLVNGLPKFKYSKDHMCSVCERGKSKRYSHPPKLVLSTHSKLELLHIDLCWPMRVATINGKKYILVIVDDYSRFIWVYFLHTKDETPEIIKKFIAQV
ncbi:integrase, catalytic region, zinc finger, CCHC-type containing protein [Tanacetum coccineum]